MTPQPRKSLIRILVWSLAMFVIALGVNALLLTIMLTLLPRGMLLDMPAFQAVPFVFIFVWGLGVVASYWKFRSLQFAATLAAIGAVLLFIVPMFLFITLFVFVGPLDLR